MVASAFTIAAHNGRFCLVRSGQPVKTVQGHMVETFNQALAEATLKQLQNPQPRAFMLGYWRAMLDADAASQDHMQRSLAEGWAHDQLLYPAIDPADLVAAQQKAWAVPLVWLGGQGAVPQKGQWQNAAVLQPLVDGLPIPALVWLYGMARLLQSTALALWAWHEAGISVDTLFACGYSDEMYQQTRYTPDAEAAARLESIRMDLADLCALKGMLAAEVVF